jgi:hypothetical protein
MHKYTTLDRLEDSILCRRSKVGAETVFGPHKRITVFGVRCLAPVAVVVGFARLDFSSVKVTLLLRREAVPHVQRVLFTFTQGLALCPLVGLLPRVVRRLGLRCSREELLGVLAAELLRDVQELMLELLALVA